MCVNFCVLKLNCSSGDCSLGKPLMGSVPLHADPWRFLSPSELILSLCLLFKQGLKRSLSLTPIATLPVLPLDPWLKLSLWFSMLLLLFLIYILCAGHWLSMLSIAVFSTLQMDSCHQCFCEQVIDQFLLPSTCIQRRGENIEMWYSFFKINFYSLNTDCFEKKRKNNSHDLDDWLHSTGSLTLILFLHWRMCLNFCTSFSKVKGINAQWG